MMNITCYTCWFIVATLGLNQMVSKDDWLATAQIRQHGHKHVLVIGMRERTRQGEVSWHEISNSTRCFADFFSF